MRFFKVGGCSARRGGAFAVLALAGLLSACSGAEGEGEFVEADSLGSAQQAVDDIEIEYGSDEDTAEEVAGHEVFPPPPLPNAPPLPAFVDLSAKVPPPGSQGRLRSCVAWATAYAAASFNEVNEWRWSPDQKRYQFSPSWIYNQINGGANRNTSQARALNLIVESGVDSLEFFPYTTDVLKQPSAESKSRASRFKAGSWSKISKSVSNLKGILASGKIVIARLDVYPDFRNMNAANPIHDTTAGDKLGGHAFALVGYDDSKNAFRLINSWGTRWADGGYGWIDYDLLSDSKLKFGAYLLNDAPDSAPPWYHLYTVAGAGLYRVDKEFGSWFRLQTTNWSGATSMAYDKGSTNLFIIHGGSIWRTSSSTGTRTKISGTVDWSGPTKMAILTSLYIIQANRLHKASPVTGQYELLGTKNWGNATAMAFADFKLWIVQDGTLYLINTTTGAATAVATGWSGPVALAGTHDDYLFAIQDNKLWRVDQTGARTQLGTGVFNNVKSMTGSSTQLFVVANETLYLVRTDGSFEVLGPANDWPGSPMFAAYQ
jgi:hypothetical protein